MLCGREDGIFQQSWPGGQVGGKEAARLFSGYLQSMESQVCSVSTVSDLPSWQSWGGECQAGCSFPQVLWDNALCLDEL